MSTSWQDDYKRKLVTPEEAVKIIKSGDHVAFTYGREPFALGLSMAARKDELKNVTVFVRTPGRDFGWYDPGWEDSFQIEISYILPIVREMAHERRCDFRIGSMLSLSSDDPVVTNADVLLVEVSTPDEHGFCSFGASVWGKKRQVQMAKKVLAEVNPNLIRTYGDNFIHVSEIDHFVEHLTTGKTPGSTDLLGRKTWQPGEVEKSIANHVSSLIKDGDTLQIGVGSTSEWVVQLGALDNKHDLGWHSETTPRGIIKLVREGVITGKYKTVHPGKAVTVAIGGGTLEDMEFVDGNPMFELYDGDYVLDPRVVSQLDNMLAINSAVCVDLTGQIGAESIGTSMVSGTGGQLAFAVGCQLAKGGRFVTSLPSTAKGGTVSRIVPIMEQGTIVTVPRTLADIVVTEYGIARLKGKTQRDRAMELVKIAHPDFKAELEKQAKELYWP
ncbi:acetyl-CoA hydrolase/transferase family protein [Chloroflexota bacterium]